jgi:hypothetical protein
MRFLFQGRDHVLKSLDVGGAHPSNHCAFEIGQVAINALGQFSSLRRWRDHKSATIRFADFSRNQSAIDQAIENTG